METGKRYIPLLPPPFPGELDVELLPAHHWTEKQNNKMAQVLGWRKHKSVLGAYKEALVIAAGVGRGIRRRCPGGNEV